MAYTPPNTFAPGTVCNSADVQGNLDALKVYLHEGVLTTDLQTSPEWIDTNHVQSPNYSAYEGLQHGVTGYQGGQDSGGPLVRATFTSSFLSGAKSGSQDWIPVPQAALRIKCRSRATLVFHFAFELAAGPDDGFSTTARLPAPVDRVAFVAPYFAGYSSIQSSSDLPAFTHGSLPTVNNSNGWNGTQKSPSAPYEVVGWGTRCGTYAVDTGGVGDFVVGLCSFSEVDRVVIINWSVAVEVYYQ